MAKPVFFLRESDDFEKGTHMPRFDFVGTVGTDLRLKVSHIRKKEVEQMAEHVGAEIVYLQGKGMHGKDDVNVKIETQG